MKNWFERIFSIDEFKISGLIIALFVVLILDIYSFFDHGDITPNLLMLNGYIVGGISGVNLIGMAINSYANRNTSMYGSSNLYGSGYGMNGMNNYGTNGMGVNGMSSTPNTTIQTPAPQQMPIVKTGVQTKI